jgi:ubiquinone/menaquinone biosynthesis C-methylase UbiE
MTVLEETFWEKGNLTKMGIYITDVEMDFFFKCVDLTKPTNALDIGSGAGRFSIPLEEKGLHVISIDLHLNSLKRLKFKNKAVNVVLSDARVIPIQENEVDLIVMVELIDIVHELQYVIEEIGRILKDGASLFLSFGNKSSIKGKLKSWRGKPYYHSYRKVVTELEKAGFTIITRQGFNWLPFNRTSNSRLIPFMAKMEKLMGLRRVVRFSPWVMIYAVKSNPNTTSSSYQDSPMSSA